MDYYGNPIMISLLNSYGEYRGHYFVSFQTLSNAIRGFFPRNIKVIIEILAASEISMNTKL